MGKSTNVTIWSFFTNIFVFKIMIYCNEHNETPNSCCACYHIDIYNYCYPHTHKTNDTKHLKMAHHIQIASLFEVKVPLC